MQRVTWSGLRVAQELSDFLELEAMPGTGVQAGGFWHEFAGIVRDLVPRNRALLARREALQAQIDARYREAGGPEEPAAHAAFLREIGYLVPEGPDFAVTTANVDPEIARMSGPQLVVPVTNARFALAAVNARWGSLYDALYGTDAIPGSEGRATGKGYDPTRGAAVVAWARDLLDRAAPLAAGDWRGVRSFAVTPAGLTVGLGDGSATALRDPRQFVGYLGDAEAPRQFLLRHNGLLIEIVVDEGTEVGATDPAHVSDVMLESAITVIVDLEDSVVAVDAEDKVAAYRNWLGLMKGDLAAEVTKGGRRFVRRLNPDLNYVTADDETIDLRTRALMLVRNVGNLVTSPAILDAEGDEVPDGIIDAMVTSLVALHDVGPEGRRANSPAGSVYIVKPKMHGPEEVAFAVELFGRVEQALGMAPDMLKIGIMDAERRTTVNLKECIRAARSRVVLVDTGSLDRTGDEIHTAMAAGAVVRKAAMRGAAWYRAYEDNAVDVGLACGLPGHAGIGKGMWTTPDRMAAMLESKGVEMKQGASTARVPSPTAATLHATHYHLVDVAAAQEGLKGREPVPLDDLLTPPVAVRPEWTPEDVQGELDDNAHGILGYVVGWIDRGVGWSRVPDVHGVGRMEDRATLRAAVQHMANWLRHGVCSPEQVEETLRRMAAIVDRQNAGDPLYRPMAPDPEASVAFQAARDLVFEGARQPNGYAEPILHRRRRERKRLDAEAAGA